MSNIKSIRAKLQKYVEIYGAITMIDFLESYVGINEQFGSLKHATHKDIKALSFKEVVSIPFDIIDNDDLAMGNVLLVTDCMHHIGAYRNPLRKEERSVSSYGKVKIKN